MTNVKIMADLVAQQYRRNDQAFARGSFRVRGDTSGDLARPPRRPRLETVLLRGGVGRPSQNSTRSPARKPTRFDKIRVYANSHYVTPRPTMQQAMKGIKAELQTRLDQLTGEGKLLEAQRLEQRTNFDLEMLEATGVCNGIENYSRYLTGRAPG